MTGFRRASTWLAALALVVTVAGLGMAGTPSAEEVEDSANDVDVETGAEDVVAAADTGTDEVAEEPSALEDLSASLAVVGDAIASAAAATGHALAATGSALASAAQATGSAIATAATWTGAQIATAAVAIGDATAWLAIEAGGAALSGLAAAGSAIAWTGTRLGEGVTWLGAGLATLAVDLGQGMVGAWPESREGQAIAASAAGGTAAAGGAAWYTRAWRYLRWAPGLAPLYTRISRDELLDHPARQKIYDAIEAEPGVHLSELARELDASWGTLLHHLRKLEKADLINSEKSNGKRCFFLPGQVTDTEQEILPALENDKARRIAEFYAENPGASQTEAAQDLDLSAALVSWHLQKLEDAGVVTREREGRCQRVGVTQEAQAVVAA